MDKYILTVTLNPVLDQAAPVSRFPPDKKKFLPVMMSAGGKGINVARGLNNLKVKHLATGFLGGTTGKLMEKMLDQEKIRHDFVGIPAETRKSMTWIKIGTARLTRTIGQGPMIPRDCQKLFLQKFERLLRDCSWVVISGRPGVGTPPLFYNQLILLAKAARVKTVLDTSGLPLRAGLRARPFMIKPNLEEAQSILKKQLKTIHQGKNAAQYFLKLGIKVVIISLGEKGAAGADENGCWFAQAPKIKAQNTVGCGDAMMAGFLYDYEKGQTIAACLKTAVAAGAANCLSLQPGNVTREQIMNLRKKVQLRSLD